MHLQFYIVINTIFFFFHTKDESKNESEKNNQALKS